MTNKALGLSVQISDIVLIDMGENIYRRIKVIGVTLSLTPDGGKILGAILDAADRETSRVPVSMDRVVCIL